ncbi:hypothetical protein ACN47E_002068 [Coniothyrium glycines]
MLHTAHFGNVLLAAVPKVHYKRSRPTPPKHSDEILRNEDEHAHRTSKKIQRMMGIQRAEPFVVPPAMPPDLVHRFEQGLWEVGVEYDNMELDMEERDGAGDWQTALPINQQIGNVDSPAWDTELKAVMDASEDFEHEVDTASNYSDTDVETDLCQLDQDCAYETSDSSSTLTDRDSSVKNRDPDMLDNAAQDANYTSSSPLPNVTATSHQYIVPRWNPGGFVSMGGPLVIRDQRAVILATSNKVPSLRKPWSPRNQIPPNSQHQSTPPDTRVRVDETVGLPVLPAHAEALWKFRFPGNTHGLLTVLLSWAHATQTLYNRLPDPKVFPFHAAFPYPVNPPKYERLISLAFFDTSATPHREILFLGPNDVAELAYGEVDTFNSSSEDAPHMAHPAPQPSSSVAATKHRLGLNHGIRSIAMRQRAATGEGRWAYILVKAHRAARDDVPAHLILAFHISAITHQSTRLQALSPAPHAHARAAAPARENPRPTALAATALPPRTSSLQNFYAAEARSKGWRHALRDANRAELSACRGDGGTVAPRHGASVLRRTVMLLEHAGDIPLIEGHRVDVGRFRPWLDAVGRGAGKLILWRDRE